MYKLTLSSRGNPDFGQDSTRSFPGVADRTVEVVDFAEASQECRSFIERHGLGGGNWTGGAITDAAGNLVGQVSYNGKVWKTGDDFKLGATPIFNPHAEKAEPADKFAYEVARIQVPGLGTLEAQGCFRAAVIKSVPGSFKIDGRNVEFYVTASYKPKGKIAFHGRSLSVLPDGDLRQSRQAPQEFFVAIKAALTKWAATPEAQKLVIRNDIKDQNRSIEWHDHAIGIAKEQIAKHEADQAAMRELIASHEQHLELFDRGSAPKL